MHDDLHTILYKIAASVEMAKQSFADLVIKINSTAILFIYFILFYFILFYFILFYFILFYFILFYFILFYFILVYFILF